MSVGIEDVNIAVSLLISDQNLFAPDPIVDHTIDICEVSSAMSDLFDELTAQVVAVVEAPFADLDITINIDKITDPLVSRVESSLANFTEGVNAALGSADCNRRFLEVIDTAVPSESPSLSLNPSLSPTQAPRSLKETIQDAISTVNAALDSVGIVLSADVSVYFNKETFSVGVTTSLTATIEQTAIEVLELLTDYISTSTDPSGDSSISKLGLQPDSSSDAPVIDLNDLLSKVVLAAGLDITFGIDLGLTQIQDAIFNSKPLGEALEAGIALHIDTWGAFAEMIVDPIDVAITLFGRVIQIRNSYFAISAELRSRGKWDATLQDMILGGDALNTSLLVPDLTIPLSTEFVFDIPATDSITVSPIISVDSGNLVDGGLSFDFDVDMGTFLSEDNVGGNTLIEVLQNATTFIQDVAALQPTLNVTGNGMSALDEFFSIINQLNDLGAEILTYIDLVNQGE